MSNPTITRVDAYEVYCRTCKKVWQEDEGKLLFESEEDAKEWAGTHQDNGGGGFVDGECETCQWKKEENG